MYYNFKSDMLNEKKLDDTIKLLYEFIFMNKDKNKIFKMINNAIVSNVISELKDLPFIDNKEAFNSYKLEKLNALEKLIK